MHAIWKRKVRAYWIYANILRNVLCELLKDEKSIHCIIMLYEKKIIVRSWAFLSPPIT